MSLSSALGHVLPLKIQRFAPQGAYLYRVVEGEEAGPGDEVVLLPRGEVPEGAKEGDDLEVFVYLDSEDRLTATLGTPYVALGEVAFLEVTDVNRVGAFVDIGLRKELMVPFAEQTRPLQVGDFEPIGMICDRSGRLAGTMRIRELLEDGGTFPIDAWVWGEAWRNEPEVGLFVILEQRYLALLPAYEPHALTRGEQARFRIANRLNDGRVELSLRAHRHEQRVDDAGAVLAKLRAEPGLRVSDDTSPEQIRALFGLSKKAFKRAVGGLLKRGAVRFERNGQIVCVDGAASPAPALARPPAGAPVRRP
jgi:predicted RNA-binding protein (virulence factor B family)